MEIIQSQKSPHPYTTRSAIPPSPPFTQKNALFSYLNAENFSPIRPYPPSSNSPPPTILLHFEFERELHSRNVSGRIHDCPGRTRTHYSFTGNHFLQDRTTCVSCYGPQIEIVRHTPDGNDVPRIQA